MINFIIAGFSKCGTTTLTALLDAHEDVFVPLDELNLFVTDNPEEIQSKYSQFFSDVTTESAIGECCTFYTTLENLEGAADHISRLAPSAKLLFIARDPVDRIESSYREFHHSGAHWGMNAPFGLDQAMDELPVLIEDSRYLRLLQPFQRAFDSDQIKVVFLEDLRSTPQNVVSECLEFLCVAPNPKLTVSQPKLNSGEGKYYDSRLLRRFRTHPKYGFKLAEIPVERQHAIFSKIGLRRRFRTAPEWSDSAKRLVSERLYHESMEFLALHGKTAEFWPRIAALRGME